MDDLSPSAIFWSFNYLWDSGLFNAAERLVSEAVDDSSARRRVFCPRHKSRKSFLRGVVKVKHSSQGHCGSSTGNINHRLRNGRALGVIRGSLTPPQFTHLLLLHVKCRRKRLGGFPVKMLLITTSWRLSAGVKASFHLNEWFCAGSLDSEWSVWTPVKNP